MDFSLLSPRKRTVNFDINDHSIRFIELRHVNPPEAHRWGERYLPPGIISEGKIIDYEAMANIMEECIDDWKIQRRSIRFIVPDSLVIIRKVSIPADVKEDEMQGYLYLELGSSIHLPFEDPVFDIYPLAIHGKMKEILLFAAPEKHVMQYANLFTQLKLNPVAADISPLSLFRLYHLVDQPKEDDILLTLQFDLTSVSMCVFEGTVPYVMRQFPISYEYEQWELIQNQTDVSYRYLGDMNVMEQEFEDIYHEISKLLDFYRYSLYNGTKEVTKFLINGDHPMLEMIVKNMLDRYELPIHTLDLGAAAKEKVENLPHKFYLSLGLALKEVK